MQAVTRVGIRGQMALASSVSTSDEHDSELLRFLSPLLSDSQEPP